MSNGISRRTAMAAMAGVAVACLPGCGALAALKVPFVRLVGAVIQRAPQAGKWLLVITGVMDNGQTESRTFGADSDEVKSVTVELKDGSKHTITPTKDGG